MTKIILTSESTPVIDREGETPPGTLIVCKTNNPDSIKRGLYWRVVQVHSQMGVDLQGRFATKTSAIAYTDKMTNGSPMTVVPETTKTLWDHLRCQ